MAPEDDVTRIPPADAREDDETVVAGPGPGRRDASHDFPVNNWNRYNFVSYVGGGGMGRVFKAFDPRLGRHVALKFIYGDDPRRVERLMREARAQAKVDHERVCKVYEVGEVEGKAFIAMQFIDGAPLDEAARDMTLEQKLIVMREVALGLHAAHRTGLIHRDVKPGNILVERTESGEFKPYIVDFGLARTTGAAALTLTGAILGTPAYIPPEQARGDAADRRSDVYGLGATLYDLLTNRPPFEGDSPTAVMIKVLQEVPESPHRINAAIPLDVEAIAMKCLRSDPQERYPSARALAEDIQRFLDGSPVAARPTGIVYRLRMKARRNKAAFAVVTAAGVLLMAAVVWGAYTEWTAVQRARLAQSFGQQVERVEALARYAYMAPLHDVRDQHKTIREQISRIQQRIGEVGGVAQGPGHYAIGRARMSLGEYEAARKDLEIAWQSGYQEPQVAYALGRVLGQLYSNALREAESVGDKADRAARKAQLAEVYRRPTLEFLQRSRGLETEAPEFVEALIAHYENRQDAALEKARQVYTRAPWIYEAHQLEGDVYATLGNEQDDKGDYDGAAGNYQKAVEAYRAAMEVGKSDPAVYASLCGLQRTRMEREISGKGRDVAPLFEAGVAACDSALRADPEDVEARVLKAWLYDRMGEHRLNRGDDPREDLHRAIETAKSALNTRPGHALAYRSIGAANSWLAKYETGRGEDPRPFLDAAIAAYQRALEIDPDSFDLWSNIGIVYKTKAGAEEERGEDPSASWESAVSSYERSLALRPDQIPANFNLGVLLYKLAERQSDPETLLQRSDQALGRVLEVNPKHALTFYQLGRNHALRAEGLIRRGEDPRARLREAVDAYRKLIELAPESAHRDQFHNALAETFRQLAVYERDSGIDPRADFAKAVDEYQESIRANPKRVFPHDNLGALRVAEAEHLFNIGQDPRAALEGAVESCREALRIKPNYFNAWLDLGEAYRTRARYELGRGLDPRRTIEEGAAALRSGLTFQARGVAAADASLTRLLVLELERHAVRGESTDPDAREAQKVLDDALRRDQNSPEAHLAAAEFHRWRAVAGSNDAVAQALKMVDRSIELKPRQAEALALRADLLVLRAKRTPERGARNESLQEARKTFQEALAVNRHLERRLRPQLTHVETLLANQQK